MSNGMGPARGRVLGAVTLCGEKPLDTDKLGRGLVHMLREGHSAC